MDARPKQIREVGLVASVERIWSKKGFDVNPLRRLGLERVSDGLIRHPLMIKSRLLPNRTHILLLLRQPLWPDGARLLKGRYAECAKVIVGCDNLNTHTKGAFYEKFTPE